MLFEMPTDVLAIIFSPEYIGLSGVFVSTRVCHFLHDFINPKPLFSEACGSAAADGVISFLRWVRASGGRINLGACAELAAAHGQSEILDYLYNCGLNIHQPTVEKAAILGGHLDTIKCIKRRSGGFAYIGDVISLSMHVGHLHVLKWLYSIYKSSFASYYNLLNGVSGGHLEVIKWYETLPEARQFNSTDMLAAVCHGHVHIVEWVVEKGWIIDRGDDYAYHATSHGRLDMLKWLILNANISLSVPLFREALYRLTSINTGVLQVVEWLHEQKCPYNVEISDYIMYHGLIKIHAIQWLKDHGYELSQRAFEFCLAGQYQKQ
jgi:hypothetical protein